MIKTNGLPGRFIEIEYDGKLNPSLKLPRPKEAIRNARAKSSMMMMEKLNRMAKSHE